jgi:hypothetical protein
VGQPAHRQPLPCGRVFWSNLIREQRAQPADRQSQPIDQAVVVDLAVEDSLTCIAPAYDMIDYTPLFRSGALPVYLAFLS